MRTLTEIQASAVSRDETEIASFFNDGWD